MQIRRRGGITCRYRKKLKDIKSVYVRDKYIVRKREKDSCANALRL